MIFTKELLDPQRLSDKVVIVLDVLFATSTIVHAFARGIDEIWPARDAADAHRIAEGLDEPMLAGEHLANHVPGFGPATPLALAAAEIRGHTLVYTTTNGTVALHNAAKAAHVYVGALSNGAALTRHIMREHPDAPVLLVCSGSVDRFNLEDFYGAGHFAEHFGRSGNYQLSDAALAATLLRRHCDATTVLSMAKVGRMMIEHDLRDEIDCAAQTDVLDVVPKLGDGCLRRVEA